MRRKGLKGHLEKTGPLLAVGELGQKDRSGAVRSLFLKLACVAVQCVHLLVLAVLIGFTALPQKALAGDFSFQWGSTHNWTANALGPSTFTLTDPYGFQVDVRLSITRIGGTALAGYPDDLLTSGSNAFGSETSIWLVWDANNNAGRTGESTNTAVMEILSGGSPFSSGTLSFRVSDIDSVDNNSATDRCDFITATGNAGNPTLSYVGAVPASRSVFIGPGTGSGSTGAIAANQAQCIYNIGATGSNSSNGDDNGSVLVTYPAGTHTATIAYDESIENVYNANRDAAARGVGIWGATILSVNQSISLAKSTTTTNYSTVGQVIPYTFVVTNNGPLPINAGQNIQIQDDRIGTFTCGTITSAIPSGGTHSCSANYTVTAADLNATNITNTARAGVGTGAQTFATRLQSNAAQAVVPIRPSITLTKISTGTTGSFPFSGTNGYTSHTITTVTPGVGVAGPRRFLTAPSVATTITEAIPAGYAMTGVTCTGTGGGTQPTVNLAAGTLSFTAAQVALGSTIACTVTNAGNPTITITKVSNGGTGAFPFSGTNGYTGHTINTVTPGIGVAGPTRVLTTASTATTITETIPAGFVMTGVTCTGTGGGTQPTVNLAAGTIAFTSAQLPLGANVACTVTNTSRPTITVSKISNGGIGAFPFSGTNGYTSHTINTVTPGVGVAGPTRILTTASTATTITETIPSGYTLGSVTCSGLGSGGTYTPNLSTGQVTFNAAAVALGSNISCTFVNNANPRLTLLKTLANGSAADTDWTLNYSGPVSGSGIEGAGGVTNVSVPTGTYTLSESGGPSNYELQFLSCTGAADTSTSGLNPQITLAAGENVVCTFTNRQGRTITLLKDVVSGTAVDTDWTLSAVSANINKSGVEGAVSITGTGAGVSTITLSESGGPSGYNLTGLSCTGTADTSTSVANPFINVDVGEHAYCTFTNTLAPSFTISKVADKSSVSANGETITYTITVDNTGGVELTGVSLSDSLTQNGSTLTMTSGPTLSGDTDSDGRLDVTETWVYTATFTVTNAVLNDGHDIINVATFSSNETPSQASSVQTSTPGLPPPCSGDNFASSNPISGVSGSTDCFNTGATGESGEPPTFGGGSLNTIWYTWTAPATGTVTFDTCDTSYTNYDTTLGVYTGSAVNALTPIVANDDGPGCAAFSSLLSFPATAGTTYHIQVGGYANDTGDFRLRWDMSVPSATISKSVDQSSISSTGTLTYTIVVTNNGAVDLTSPTLTDALTQNGSGLTLTSGPTLSSGDSNSNNILETTETWVYTATFDVTSTEISDANDLINSATFSSAQTSAITDSATTTISFVPNPSLSVTKFADDDTNVTVGQVITYTYVITNDGNQVISNISLGDVHGGSGAAPVPNADTATLTDNDTTGDSSNPTTGDNDWDTLAPGDVLTVTATYTVTQNDVDTLQ